MRFALVAVPVVVVLTSSPGNVTEVVATKAVETSPSTHGTDLAWTQGVRDGPVIVMKLGTVFLRRDHGSTIRITPRGILGASGGMDARTLVVQIIRDRGSDIELFDLKTRRLRDPPRGVNTHAWEWRGSISGHHLLFGRFSGDTYQVVLTDLASGRKRILDSVSGHGAYAEPGQINGRYAVWAGCPDNFCTVYRLDVASGRTIQVPGDYQHATYAPSVAANGEIFYGRGLKSCGAGVKLMRYRPGGAPRLVAALPPGYDFRFTNTDGRQLLFDRVRCRDGDFDVYGVRVTP